MVCEFGNPLGGQTAVSLNPCFNGIWSASYDGIQTLTFTEDDVLILVLMEYGLRGDHAGSSTMPRSSLNPCFDGIWSARSRARSTRQLKLVCLNPCFDGIWSARSTVESVKARLDVLILVLMEYGLRDLQLSRSRLD